MIEKFKSLLLLSFSLAILLPSCVPDEFTADYNADVLLEPKFSGPVVYGSLSLEDILAEFDTMTIIGADTNNLIYIAYSDFAGEIFAEEWISVPDQKFRDVFFYQSPVDIPGWTLGDTGDQIAPPGKTEKFRFAMENNQRLDRMVLKKGTMHIDVESTLKHMGKVELFSDQIKIGGSAYRDTINISDLSGTFFESVTRSLDGSTLNLDNQSDPDTTFLEINFILTLIHSGADILANEAVRVSVSFTDLEVQKAFGSVGDYDTVLVENDTIEVGMFQKEFSGNVYFANPYFTLVVNNSFGVPIGFEIFDLKGFSEETGITTDVTFKPGVLPFIIDAPDTNMIGQTVETPLTISRLISNIDEIANTTLSRINYSIRINTNPLGSDVQHNFFLDTSRVRVDYELRIPLNLRAEDFELQDTIDVDFSGIPEENDAMSFNGMTVFLFTENWIPSDIVMQVTWVDSAYNEIDVVFSEGPENVLPSGILDNGKVTSPSKNELRIEYSVDRITGLRETRHAIVNASLETANEGQDFVKFYSYYTIDFKLGMEIDISYDTSKENN